ncbi:MAG: ribonucleoside-triphosphate reductase [Nitrospirae bacterium]|nr:MAG: ribonucleoside-triphosphate reductase [Nitrospirota bacterium]
MSVTDEILTYTASTGGTCTEKKGVYRLSIIVAERKAFLSKKKLTYTLSFRVDDENRTIRFTEMLSESGLGLSGGSTDDSPGFGFKAESYNTFATKPREGTIQEQSTLFGKQYTYAFEFSKVREEIERIALAAGYRPAYQLTPAGL